MKKPATRNPQPATRNRQPATTLIIFSRDRAMQLECLLRSITENTGSGHNQTFYNIIVQYTTQFQAGYDTLMAMHSNVLFIDERSGIYTGIGNDFRRTFLGILRDNHESGRFCLMVDDDIVFRKIDPGTIPAKFDIFSLRLGARIRKRIHFDYTGSVDGNIFRKDVLWPVFNEQFDNPNKLEVALVKITKGRYQMLYFAEPRLVGIPNNKVSDTSSCMDMGGDITELNRLFMEGYRIDYGSMDLDHDNVHKEVKYKFKKPEVA